MSISEDLAADDPVALREGESGRHVSIPRFRMRWGIVILLALSNAIVFLDRTNLSVALPQIKSEFNLSPAMSGLVLSSFFWVYAVMQLPAGALVDKISSKIMLAAATLFWAIVTVITAAVNGFAALFGLRLLLGAGESVTAPTYSKVVSAWFSDKERSVATAIWDSGNRFGTAAALPAITAMSVTWGWRWAFVVSGVVAVVFVPIWWLYYNRAVAKNVREFGVSPENTSLQSRTAVQSVSARDNWAGLFKLRPMWILMAGYYCLLFVNYFFITWFPAYLVVARHFTPAMLGLMGVIPAVCAMCADWLGGLTSAYLLRSGRSLTFSRKLPIVAGLLVASLIAVVPAIDGAWPVIILLSISFSGTTFASSCVWCLPAEMAPSPRRVGSVAGLQNFAGNLAGISGPIIIGVLYGATGSFAAPLALAGGIVLLGSLLFLFALGPVRPMRRRSSLTAAASPVA